MATCRMLELMPATMWMLHHRGTMTTMTTQQNGTRLRSGFSETGSAGRRHRGVGVVDWAETSCVARAGEPPARRFSGNFPLVGPPLEWSDQAGITTHPEFCPMHLAGPQQAHPAFGVDAHGVVNPAQLPSAPFPRTGRNLISHGNTNPGSLGGQTVNTIGRTPWIRSDHGGARNKPTLATHGDERAQTSVRSKWAVWGQWSNGVAGLRHPVQSRGRASTRSGPSIGWRRGRCTLVS